MKAIKIAVTGSDACVTEKPVITSGMVGLPVEFTFDEVWNGLGKSAVFRAGSRSYPVSCLQSSAIVPWEVLEKPGVGLYVGVIGADEKGIVKIPTVWTLVDTIAPGVRLPDTVAEDPTPSVYDQILTMANKAMETAELVREDADNGAFIGPAGPKGDAGAITFVVAAELPETGDYSKLYLIPEENAEQPNRFGEYVFVEGSWERIGSAGVEVNLDAYVKKTDAAVTSGGNSAGELGLTGYKNPVYGGLDVKNGCVSIFAQNNPIADRRKGVEHQAVTTAYFNDFLRESLVGSKYRLELTEEEKADLRQWLGVATN